MAPKVSDLRKKCDVETIEAAQLSAKRSRKRTQRLLESQQQFTPLPTQPTQPESLSIDIPSSLSQPSQQESPRRQLSPHTLFMSVRASSETPFEPQIRDNKLKEALLALEDSAAVTDASDDLVNGAVDAVDGAEGVVEEPSTYALAMIS